MTSNLNLKQTVWVTANGRYIYQDTHTCATYLLANTPEGPIPVPFNSVEGIISLDEYKAGRSRET